MGGAHPMPGAAPAQPGLMAQMAATAGGVAIGSAVVRFLVLRKVSLTMPYKYKPCNALIRNLRPQISTLTVNTITIS